jgi:pimeloyl-ACP methyl ester carboxylesterase
LNNKSAIVFVHGAGSSSHFWHWQRPAFPDAHYLDLPGHGKNAHEPSPILGRGSSVVGRPSSVEDYADWVATYIETANLHDVILNGHSMGGAITLTLALRRPGWLRAIILTGTGARLRVSPTLLELLRTDYPAAVEAILQASFAPHTDPLTYAQKVRINGTRRQLLRMPQEVTPADYEACDRFDITERVHEITLPTLCIVGEQDAMTPGKYSQYLHDVIPGSQLRIIEGAGHMLPIEKPEEYNSTVAAFLESCTTNY